MASAPDLVMHRVGRKLLTLQGRLFSDTLPLSEWKVALGDYPGGKGLKPKDSRAASLPIHCPPGTPKAYFSTAFIAPRSWRGQEVVAHVVLRNEAVVFVDGAVRFGADPQHEEIPIAPAECDGRRHTLGLEVWSDCDGMGRPATLTLENARLCILDAKVEYALRFFWAAHDLVRPRAPAMDLPHADLLLAAVEEAVDRIETGAERARLHESIDEAVKRYLERTAAVRKGPPLATFSVIGHAHLDSAWLWPVAVTRRKNVRTIANVLQLMRRFPKFTYIMSQAVQYVWAKEDFPEQYAELKRRVKEGRWEPGGGMWVESDCNVTSGESLVRQCLHGKRFFRQEFGIDCKYIWLPDVFGYSYALPQIYKQCGIDWFYTSKLSWNETNQMPHDLFRWKGVDGTEVGTFLTRGTYNGTTDPHFLRHMYERFPDKDLARQILIPYGRGNGGGGPSRQHVTTAAAVPQVTKALEVKHELVEDFLRTIFKNSDRLPVWDDELYFELHRGTFTSQARTKKLNRQSEVALRGAEIACSFAKLDGARYPQAELESTWKKMLFNQFHDILPGSSIGKVYEQTERELGEAIADADRLRDAALARLCRDIDTRGPGTPVVLFNPVAWRRRTLVEVAVPSANVAALDENGSPVPAQIEPGRPAKLLFEADLPPMGHAVYWLARGKTPMAKPGKFSGILENDFLRARIDANGELTSVIHKATGRETIPAGSRGNRIRTYQDVPREWEAWDIDGNYPDLEVNLFKTASVRLVSAGPVAQTVEVVRRSKLSTWKQRIVLAANAPFLRFDSDVDWQDRRMLVKAEFPVDVRARNATYEIQFGTIQRPAHRNTSWDVAKFEVPAQRWADLGEADFGAAVLNDCKYGHHALEQTLGLTLLRAPNGPDPSADRGRQVFTYAFLPHAGDWRSAEVTRRAYELNHPIAVLKTRPHAGSRPARRSFLSVDAPNVYVDTVKKAEDSNDLIVRVYEGHGARTDARLSLERPVRSAAECNLMEEKDRKSALDGGAVRFTIQPYEIKTLKIRV